MVSYSENNKVSLDELLLQNRLIRPGKMFGYPAYYVGKKLCICLYEQGVGIKLPDESVKKLLGSDPNIIPFGPLGRPKMREWIQINLERSEDYRQYQAVFDESIHYVLSQQDKNSNNSETSHTR
jgi:hypothetical protein